jgi:hypothetical protein
VTWPGRSTRFGLVLLTVLVGWALVMTHAPRSDLLVFDQAGRDLLAGRDPYRGLHSSQVVGGHAFVYPWLVGYLFVPFAVLPWPGADVAYFLVSVAAVLLGCRLLGVSDPWSVACVLLAGTTWRGFQVGSLNALLFAGCALVWRYRAASRVAGPVLAVVVAAKLFLAPLLGWAWLARRPRLFVIAVSGAGLVVTLSWVLGPMSPSGFAQLLDTVQRREAGQSLSLDGLLGHGLGSAAAASTGLVAAGSLLVLAWWLRRRYGAAAEPTVFGLCLVASLVATPVLWSHYLLLAFVPLLVVRAPLAVLAGAAVLGWFAAPPVSALAWKGPGWPANVLVVQLALAVVVALLAVRAARRPAVVRSAA